MKVEFLPDRIYHNQGLGYFKLF